MEQHFSILDGKQEELKYLNVMVENVKFAIHQKNFKFITDNIIFQEV
ncbi:MAG: hypothetical protein P8O16_14675 [Algoriphagus sp.]|nr:hypothetical protein [Algoriphagus sp.]MDG1278525.1 hypothetical protein [Algoriphagus sp.]